MTLSNRAGDTIIYDGVISINLPVERSVLCPPLKYTVLPHGLVVVSLGGMALILPLPGIFLNKALWVGIERAKTGELLTVVFNMSKLNVRVKKGEAVSELVMLAGPEPLEHGGPGKVKFTVD